MENTQSHQTMPVKVLGNIKHSQIHVLTEMFPRGPISQPICHCIDHYLFFWQQNNIPVAIVAIAYMEQ